MREHGPFDGLMGFSQGATVATLVALLQHWGKAFEVKSEGCMGNDGLW